MPQQVDGILLLDKPTGITSNKALQMVKHLFNAKKAGHTGSLDPLATGMLPICFGEATKFSQFLLNSDKTYYVVAKLGVQTTTGDGEGEVTVELPVENIDEERVKTVLNGFLGEIEQIPPMFSAIKHQGKPLYKLARQGIEIAREPRSVHILSIELQWFAEDKVAFKVHCSKGTYVRTLVEDIGKQLGCGAHVAELRRQQVNPYQDASMFTLPALESIKKNLGTQSLTECLLPLETSVQRYPVVQLSTAATFYLRMGQPVRAPFPIDSALVRLISEDGKFLGMGEVMDDGRVKAHRLLSQQATV
jgi:tRNA pseudouridine55 synthase